eukprot:TRINITY_DN6030_c0_g2_i1.p1 TRINITY_DN6030_c0_g2~~TRINITY_DN6030_c0_g2_i1.p1  ORF type:complete len:362 (-),score=56.53 TRINITY_DN6030_c0_g2_i1:55-1140(-)
MVRVFLALLALCGVALSKFGPSSGPLTFHGGAPYYIQVNNDADYGFLLGQSGWPSYASTLYLFDNGKNFQFLANVTLTGCYYQYNNVYPPAGASIVALDQSRSILFCESNKANNPVVFLLTVEGSSLSVETYPQPGYFNLMPRSDLLPSGKILVSCSTAQNGNNNFLATIDTSNLQLESIQVEPLYGFNTTYAANGDNYHLKGQPVLSEDLSVMIGLGTNGTSVTQLTQQVAFGPVQTSETFVASQFDVSFFSPSIAMTSAANMKALSVLTWDLTSMSIIQYITFPSTAFTTTSIVAPTGNNVFVWANSGISASVYLLPATQKGVGDVTGQLSVQGGAFAVGREYAFITEQNNQLYRVPYS